MNTIENVEPGKPVEVQLSPYGEFIKRHADGSQTVQNCDPIAFGRVLATWVAAGRQKILFDFDHDKKRTIAAAWIIDLRVDPKEGLMGTLDFTPTGAKAVNAREYRFPSVDWDVSDDDGRPFKLRTVGMTNRNNIPVRPILNSQEGEPSQNGQTQTTRKQNMDKIAQALGLDATATEDAVIAAIAELTAKVKAAEEAALDAEAKNAAKDNSTRVENSEEFIKAYKANPAAVKAAMAALKPVKPAAGGSTRVTNSEDATAPAHAAARKFPTKAAAQTALAAQPVGQRKKFFAENKAEFED